MLIVCASVSGAPGVSTLAVGLTARWPHPGALLLEADPCGGVVAARFGLAQHPGLTSLAASARHGLPEDVSTHVQRLRLGGDVIVAPGAAETAAGATAVLARNADTLGQLAPVVIADVGRLHVGSPAMALVAAADAVLIVATASTEHLDHLDARIPVLRDLARFERLGVVLSGKGDYPDAEVAERLGVPVWARLPRDRWGAGVLSGRLTGPSWARTRLAQASRDLATRLHDTVVTEMIEVAP